MKYNNILKAEFRDRPNRFIAHVELHGHIETVHVKNTGRCRELLVPGCQVMLEESGNPARKTRYDLVSVCKNGRWINMDSQAPNQAAAEWVQGGGLFPEKVTVYRERKYGNSRFDLFVESPERKAFIEVKGVTLEEDNIAMFPDAPTERGVKHVEELINCMQEGYEAYLLLVIQMKGIQLFRPNWDTHHKFGEVLVNAQKAGVKILAYDCLIGDDFMEIQDPVPLDLKEPGTEAVETEIPDLSPEASKTDLPGEIVNRLVDWYRKNKRVLPWRDKDNAYYTWISEIMLQQTRVEAVKPYFLRFIKELPDIQALACCPEEKLMKLWEGLGYYNRVRNMQKAAIQIMEEYDGKIPDSYEKILSLKGIGNYTAGAIASIAYGIPVPAVDGNVLRVVSRIEENPGDIMKQSVRHKTENNLKVIMPEDCPGDFNQALMELGAVVCVPNGQPKCEECPAAFCCKAFIHGTIEQFPVKAPKKARKTENRTVLVIQDGNYTAIRKRPGKGLLAGLYELPNIKGHLKQEEVLEKVRSLNLDPLYIEPLPEAKHIFSHIEWRMTGYRIRVAALEKRNTKDLIFADRKESDKKYAIPSAFNAYIKYMKEETVK